MALELRGDFDKRILQLAARGPITLADVIRNAVPGSIRPRTAIGQSFWPTFKISMIPAVECSARYAQRTQGLLGGHV